MENWFQDPVPLPIPLETKIHGGSSLLHKIAEYLHIPYAHPITYLKSSLITYNTQYNVNAM